MLIKLLIKYHVNSKTQCGVAWRTFRRVNDFTTVCRSDKEQEEAPNDWILEVSFGWLAGSESDLLTVTWIELTSVTSLK